MLSQRCIAICTNAYRVGGWKKYGIDPSRFSSELMKHCSDLVKAGDFASNRPDELIAKAFERLSVAPRPIG